MKLEAEQLENSLNLDNVSRNELLQQIEKPKFLFFGMPDRATHFFEMNNAQPPQGPMLNSNFSFLPELFRGFVNQKLEKVFNPKREAPYSGLHLIKQNLEKDLPHVSVRLIDHPKRKEILELIDKEYFPIIGISIGCENQIPDAEDLVEEIQQRYKKWSDMIKFLLNGKNICPQWAWNIPGLEAVDSKLKEWASAELKKRFGEKIAKKISKNPDLLDLLSPTIVSGNYGASAAKRIFGNKTPLNINSDHTHILWDDINERKEKREQGLEPFIGEGVHDIRIFLKQIGFKLLSNPKDPIISKPVTEPNPVPKSPLKKRLIEAVGLTTAPSTKVSLNTAVGCGNKCAFCNTAEHFQREKSYLFKDRKNDVDAMFQSIMERVEQEKNNSEVMPEIYVWVLDENIGQNNGAIEKMCRLVIDSGENIRWGTSTDIKGLWEYKKKHGNFRELASGGLNVIWVGIESKDDFFDKRGEADVKFIEEMVKELQSLGIVIIGSFIVGLPIQTEGKTIVKPDGKHEKINIWEDIAWWKKLNTASRQVMMNTETILIKGRKALTEKLFDEELTTIDLLGVKDSEFGHITVNNKTDIPDRRLEQIDRLARRELYQENGPVVLQTLMTWWDGYMNLKDSKDPAELCAATYNYWMAKRFLHMVSLGTIYFSETFFEKCSDKFLERFAKFLSEVDEHSAPEGELNDKYQKVFDEHYSKISGAAKFAAEYLRNNFIQKVNKRKQTNHYLAPQHA